MGIGSGVGAGSNSTDSLNSVVCGQRELWVAFSLTASLKLEDKDSGSSADVSSRESRLGGSSELLGLGSRGAGLLEVFKSCGGGDSGWSIGLPRRKSSR